MSDPDTESRREERVLLTASAAYLLLAAVLTTLWRGGTTDHLVGPVQNLLSILWFFRLPLCIGTALLALAAVRGAGSGPVRRAFVAAVATGLFFAAFTTIKASMPMAMPFWADPPLAALDRMLHGGTDAWAIAHRLAPWIDAQTASALYLLVWLPLALGFPILLMLSDGDTVRRRRFLALYAVVWIVLGNVLALLFLSGGPVYADRLTGGSDFAGLGAAFAASGIAETATASIHEGLWHAFVTGENRVGSGISAFPSVHVGIASVFALYAVERWGKPGVIAIAYAGAILFLSVYLGWHYAVDGYASIAVVLAANAMMKRRGALPHLALHRA
ncbi:phosphatase PAP2 family protein [Roseisalinus antarcticus]|uniref:Inositolphosphotransferase Aur1/Ipt1 domain-containing protein n=1 Tax=Roseisalinus antarcticus TaxID=254357 RepID=A0A1Y5RPR2_9RHOB|nr:phosphatase PAP2 family protein [Roseisalinus antarcticus]SLN21330.1 hypothetical protein ROA7023_00555 [Roseisalinus antarcticus]